MSVRPFKVLGIQQVAIGGPSKERLRTLWVEKFGLEVVGNFRSERENVDEDICAIGSGAFKVEVDLMEPIDPHGKPALALQSALRPVPSLLPPASYRSRPALDSHAAAAVQPP